MYRTGLREAVIVTIRTTNDFVTRIEYHNAYHMTGIYSSQRWYRIDCRPTDDCFMLIKSVGRNVSERNKYFWSSSVHKDTKIMRINDVLSTVDLGKVRASRNGHLEIANLLTFNGFISYWILQDVIPYNITHVGWASHSFPPVQKPPSHHIAHRITYISLGPQRFSYVTCYEVQPINSGHLYALVTPFDWATWACIVISFLLCLVICLFITAKNGLFNIDGMAMGDSFSGVRMLIAIRVILVGTVLSNWYTTIFTMEMIVPVTYVSTWNNLVQDVEGLQVMIPFSLLDEIEIDTSNMSDISRHAYFFNNVMQRLVGLSGGQGNKRQLSAYVKLAKNTVNFLRSYLGIGTDGRSYGNGTYNKQLAMGMNAPYDRNTFKKSPVQPISHREPNLLLKSLSTCGKVAFIDTKDNIAELTPFLNDNKRRIKYLRGDDDILFSVPRGWQILSVRYNYGLKRLKVMITSGILSHWEMLYSFQNHRKGFTHYAN
ncbi:hypothetical protein Fcan01_16195 [Folsomia candida]|uniref:Uncharacterized protein n=1 Tax=Folsomia candida TaxID=158441 RepID=A0A226DTL0_FOLCA|nr:hypothetical protein Fcan01_16195 [Folsomia candida]